MGKNKRRKEKIGMRKFFGVMIFSVLAVYIILLLMPQNSRCDMGMKCFTGLAIVLVVNVINIYMKEKMFTASMGTILAIVIGTSIPSIAAIRDPVWWIDELERADYETTNTEVIHDEKLIDQAEEDTKALLRLKRL